MTKVESLARSVYGEFMMAERVVSPSRTPRAPWSKLTKRERRVWTKFTAKLLKAGAESLITIAMTEEVK